MASLDQTASRAAVRSASTSAVFATAVSTRGRGAVASGAASSAPFSRPALDASEGSTGWTATRTSDTWCALASRPHEASSLLVAPSLGSRASASRPLGGGDGGGAGTPSREAAMGRKAPSGGLAFGSASPSPVPPKFTATPSSTSCLGSSPAVRSPGQFWEAVSDTRPRAFAAGGANIESPVPSAFASASLDASPTEAGASAGTSARAGSYGAKATSARAPLPRPRGAVGAGISSSARGTASARAQVLLRQRLAAEEVVTHHPGAAVEASDWGAIHLEDGRNDVLMLDENSPAPWPGSNGGRGRCGKPFANNGHSEPEGVVGLASTVARSASSPLLAPSYDPDSQQRPAAGRPQQRRSGPIVAQPQGWQTYAGASAASVRTAASARTAAAYGARPRAAVITASEVDLSRSGGQTFQNGVTSAESSAHRSSSSTACQAGGGLILPIPSHRGTLRGAETPAMSEEDLHFEQVEASPCQSSMDTSRSNLGLLHRQMSAGGSARGSKTRSDGGFLARRAASARTNLHATGSQQHPCLPMGQPFDRNERNRHKEPSRDNQRRSLQDSTLQASLATTGAPRSPGRSSGSSRGPRNGARNPSARSSDGSVSPSQAQDAKETAVPGRPRTASMSSSVHPASDGRPDVGGAPRRSVVASPVSDIRSRAQPSSSLKPASRQSSSAGSPVTSPSNIARYGGLRAADSQADRRRASGASVSIASSAKGAGSVTSSSSSSSEDEQPPTVSAGTRPPARTSTTGSSSPSTLAASSPGARVSTITPVRRVAPSSGARAARDTSSDEDSDDSENNDDDSSVGDSSSGRPPAGRNINATAVARRAPAAPPRKQVSGCESLLGSDSDSPSDMSRR